MRHAKKGHRVISMDILEHLQKLYPALTKKQKTIADYLIANPEEISYITLAQLSHQTGTSELTLLRFCQKLGYSNFLDLKEQFRDYTQKMIKQASSSSFFLPERTSGEDTEREQMLHEICNTEAAVFSDFITNINLESVIKASDEIRKSTRIYIFANDISLVPGKFLQSRLEILYLNSALIDLSDLEVTQKIIQQLTDGDLVIFFSFPRYYFPIGNIAKKAAKSGVPILTITDSDTSPAAAHSTLLLLCPTSTKLFYNSMTAPMAMLNILASCLVIDSVSPSERQIFIDTLPSLFLAQKQNRIYRFPTESHISGFVFIFFLLLIGAFSNHLSMLHKDLSPGYISIQRQILIKQQQIRIGPLCHSSLDSQ